MSAQTNIEWTDSTWNPVKGCTKISPGCKHCYAETFAERWRGTPGHPYEQGFDLRLAPHKLHEPLTWTKPTMVFVNSMSDLYHPDIPPRYLAAVHRVMAAAPWHTFQVLTKRADLMAEYHTPVLDLPNVWLGVSVEDRKYGIPRIAALKKATVGVRFLSIEPLLEDLGTLDLRGIEWVIVGGESGPGARPMKADWVRSIRDQCEERGVKFFFKQWGGVNKKKNGRLLEGQTYDDMPDRPVVPLPSHAVRKALVADAKGWADKWAGTPLTQIRAR